MKSHKTAAKATVPADVFCTPQEGRSAIPVWLVAEDAPLGRLEGLADTGRAWLETQRFTGSARKQVLLPGPDGRLAGVVLGAGDGQSGDPCGPSALLTGQLASSLPAGTYRLAGGCREPALAALAWGLGAYRFGRYKSAASEPGPRLVMPDGVHPGTLLNQVEAVWTGRDLINTPASDLGPAELEAAARRLAADFGAAVAVIAGEDLLKQSFPLIHAVGRASPRPPRLIDVTWRKKGGSQTAPALTLVGKGITFDTGGLDIKPASAMLLMKKDMGGAATALTLARMIMGQGLDVRLRLLVAAAENSVSGNAFRPGDILKSRAGITVEIGNTDAEGRLVLADALALAGEEKTDTTLVFATLTGAARTALGPDLPALFTDDDDLAKALVAAGRDIGDPLWRLPLWAGYNRHLESDVADINNVWDSPFAGAITAALFLKRFVRNTRRFAHFDLYGWRTAARPLGPKGGEPQTARAVLETLKRELAG